MLSVKEEKSNIGSSSGSAVNGSTSGVALPAKGSSATPANEVSCIGDGAGGASTVAPNAVIGSKGDTATPGLYSEPLAFRPGSSFCGPRDCNQGNAPSSVGEVCNSSPLASRLNSGVSSSMSGFSVHCSLGATAEVAYCWGACAPSSTEGVYPAA